MASRALTSSISKLRSSAEIVRISRAFTALLLIGFSIGCKGTSVKEDNPVFTSAPPRRSLINRAADAEEQRLAQQGNSSENAVVPVSFHEIGVEPLTGSSVVATVNGKPIFVDDILGGFRRRIESDPGLTDEQRQGIMLQSLRLRTKQFAEDTLVYQTLEATFPEEQRKLVRESLEPAFLEVCENMMKENNLATDDELKIWLEDQGLTRNEMKEAFVRRQFIMGYIQTKAKVPSQIDRAQLVGYYQQHIDEFTPDEEIRFAEIVVRFADHDGRDGAEDVMTTIVQRIRREDDFGTIASELSDVLSGEKRGDIGWIKRGTLADKKLEAMLFEMPAGAISSVQVHDDRFEVYKVIDRRDPKAVEFQSAQKEIEAKLLAEIRKSEEERVVKELVAKSNIVTIFDGEKPESTRQR